MQLQLQAMWQQLVANCHCSWHAHAATATAAAAAANAADIVVYIVVVAVAPQLCQLLRHDLKKAGNMEMSAPPTACPTCHRVLSQLANASYAICFSFCIVRCSFMEV